MIVGLDKNTYAGVNYNPLLWMTMILGVGLGFFWPFAAIFFYEGHLQILFAWICGVLMVSSGWMAIRMKITPFIAVCVPFIVAIFIFTIMRAGIIFYIRGGIKWRGTLYTKEQLQSGRF